MQRSALIASKAKAVAIKGSCLHVEAWGAAKGRPNCLQGRAIDGCAPLHACRGLAVLQRWALIASAGLRFGPGKPHQTQMTPGPRLQRFGAGSPPLMQRDRLIGPSIYSGAELGAGGPKRLQWCKGADFLIVAQTEDHHATMSRALGLRPGAHGGPHRSPQDAPRSPYETHQTRFAARLTGEGLGTGQRRCMSPFGALARSSARRLLHGRTPRANYGHLAVTPEVLELGAVRGAYHSSSGGLSHGVVWIASLRASPRSAYRPDS